MNRDLLSVIKRFSGLNVLVVGDVMIDRYVYGEVSRISPEAPVPVVGVTKSEDRLGGAANVAVNIRALGATPWLCSVIGQDENGEKFSDLLPLADLPDSGILRSSDRPTTVKTRIVAQNQHLIRLDEESTMVLTAKEFQGLQAKIIDLLNRNSIDVILVQDYNKGVMTIPMIRFIIDESKERKVPLAVDPKHQNFWEYKDVTLFKPNLSEVRIALKSKLTPSLAALSEAALKIREFISADYVLITLSEKGSFIDAPPDSFLTPTQARQIADVSGAGDSVISIVSLAVAMGLDTQSIAVLANLAGGQVCEQFGVVPIDKARLLLEAEQKVKELNRES